MMTPTLLPAPVADCAAVADLLAGLSARPSACKPAGNCKSASNCKPAAKDLNGSFRIVGGSLRVGAVHLAYTKDGFRRPRYHLSAERGGGGLWRAHCDCDHFYFKRECKHCVRAALALPTWPDESCELMRLLLGDDGRRAFCPACEAGTMRSVNWRRPNWTTLLTWVCDNPDCGRRAIL